MLILAAGLAHGQTVTSVSASSNGTLLKPANLWTANAIPTLTGNNTFAGNNTFTGNNQIGNDVGTSTTTIKGAILAPNASSTNATSVANVGALDGRFTKKTHYAVAVANTDVAASTAFVTVLTLNVTESGVYFLDMLSNIAPFSSTGGGKTQVVVGTATITGGKGTGTRENTTNIAFVDVCASYGTSWSGYQAYLIRRGIVTVSAAGTVLIQFAQNASDPLACRYQIGSYAILTRID